MRQARLFGLSEHLRCLSAFGDIAWQKDQMGLFIIKRAGTKITLANLACTMHRLIFHERSAAMGMVAPG